MPKHLIEQNGITQEGLENALSTDTYYVTTIVTAQSYTGVAADLNVLGGNYVLVTEGTENYDDPTGVPLRVEFQFDNVDAFNYFHCNYAYYKVGGGATNHTVNLEIYNVVLAQWDSIMSPIIADEEIVESVTFTAVGGGSEYITEDANLRVRVRFNHTDNGINTHRLALDHVALYKGITGVPSESHIGLSGRSEPNQHPTSAITGLDSALTNLMPLAHGVNNHVPSGFVDHTTTTLSLVENVGAVNDTFSVTITGTDFPLYANGTLYTKNTETVTQVGATTRRYYIYYDSTGTLTLSNTPWNLESGDYDGSAPVCTVYWDAVFHQGVLEEERHHAWRDVKWHHWAHHTIGTRLSQAHYPNGFAITFGGASPNLTFSSTIGSMYDEDIDLTIPTTTVANVYYHHDANTMKFVKDSTKPYLTVANVPQYDTGSGIANKIGNNITGHFVTWVYASNSYVAGPDSNIAMVVGQDTNNLMTLAEARAVGLPTLPADFILEWRLLYKLIFLNGLGNNISYVELVDYRNVTTLPAGALPSAIGASAVVFTPYSTTTSTNVQAAIEELTAEKLNTTLYDGYTVVVAQSDDAPVAITVAEQTVVGRATGGNITALSIDSDLSTVSASDDTIPSAKATKAMGDLKLPLAGGTMSGDITLGENTAIALDPALSVDGKYSGITITGTAGATLAFGDLITLDKDDSRWELVDISVAAAATGDARGLLGICVLAAAADGNATKILLVGNVRADANFPALTIGAAVYASTTGDIISTQPSTTDYVIRIIGWAMTADELFFNPDGAWITKV